MVERGFWIPVTMSAELDRLALEIAVLMGSDDPDHGADAARQLRAMSIAYRSAAEHSNPQVTETELCPHMHADCGTEEWD